MGGNVDNIVRDAPAKRLDPLSADVLGRYDLRSYQHDIAYGNYDATGIRHNFVHGHDNLPGYKPARDANRIQKDTAARSRSDLVSHHLQAVANLPPYNSGATLYRGSSILKENFDLLQKGKHVQAHQIGFFSESKLIARSFADGDGIAKVNVIWRVKEPPEGVFKHGLKNGAHYGNIASDFSKRGIRDTGPIKIGDAAEVLVQPGSLFNVVSVKEEVIRHNDRSRVVYKVDLEYVRHDNNVHDFSLQGESGNALNEYVTPRGNTSGMHNGVGEEEVFNLNIRRDGNGVDNGAPPPPAPPPPIIKMEVKQQGATNLRSLSTGQSGELGQKPPQVPRNVGAKAGEIYKTAGEVIQLEPNEANYFKELLEHKKNPSRNAAIQTPSEGVISAGRKDYIDKLADDVSKLDMDEKHYYSRCEKYHKWESYKKKGQQKYEEFKAQHPVAEGTTTKYNDRYVMLERDGATETPFVNDSLLTESPEGKYWDIKVKENDVDRIPYQFRVSDNNEVLVVDEMYAWSDALAGGRNAAGRLPMNEIQGEFIKSRPNLMENIKYITQENIASPDTKAVMDLLLSGSQWIALGRKPLVLKPGDAGFNVMLTTPNVQPTARMLSTYPEINKEIKEIRVDYTTRITIVLDSSA